MAIEFAPFREDGRREQLIATSRCMMRGFHNATDHTDGGEREIDESLQTYQPLDPRLFAKAKKFAAEVQKDADALFVKAKASADKQFTATLKDKTKYVKIAWS